MRDSDQKKEAADMLCCASCGKAEIDDIKLTDCDKCDRARYCSDECKQDHRPEHEAICKERAAKLRDELLFRQPESTNYGDCPICCLPMPLKFSAEYVHQRGMYLCCGKMVCNGCNYANRVRIEEANTMRQVESQLNHLCPFCRKPLPKSEEEVNTMVTNRAARNDPAALYELGMNHIDGGDYDEAFEYLSRAAELGYALAHIPLYYLYHEGNGVEKDEKMGIYHLEEAAIAGHPESRLMLGCFEQKIEKYERSVKHCIIAANLGSDNAIQLLKGEYKRGHASKDDLAAALRAHQAAVDATKSPQRELAEKNYRQHKRR